MTKFKVLSTPDTRRISELFTGLIGGRGRGRVCGCEDQGFGSVRGRGRSG